MFLNYGFSFTSSALLLKHKKPPKDLFSATCSVLSLNVTVGEHSESLQDFNTVSDQRFKQHAHISAPIKVQLSRSAAGMMWGVTDCNFTVNTKAARAWQCHLRGEESFNETRLTRPEVTHGAHVMSGRVVMAGLWDGRRLHTLRQTHIKPVEDVRMSVMWSRSCCFSFRTFSVSMQMIRSSLWLFCVCLSSLCGSLLPRCVSMSSFFSVFVAVLKICGTFLCLWGCVLGICGLVASLFSHFWRAEVVYECLWLISRYSRWLLLHCVSFPVCLCRCATNPWVISVFVLLFCM